MQERKALGGGRAWLTATEPAVEARALPIGIRSGVWDEEYKGGGKS